MDVWFTENQAAGLRISIQVKDVLARVKTPYQEVVVTDTVGFGRMLTLDDVVQTTERDEFIYHEMLCHVPMCSHPNPRRVLIIGGGDGGAVREVLRHETVEKCDLVEIDGEVVAQSRKHLPSISGMLDDPRVRVIIDDGIKYAAGIRSEYDVIIIDSTDPIGAAVGLFSRTFYEAAFKALAEDGVFAAQTESPFFNSDLIRRISRDMTAVFPNVGLYLACVPTYPGGLWSFTIGSKKYDLQPAAGLRDIHGTRYYNHAVHRAAFALPEFVRDLVPWGKA